MHFVSFLYNFVVVKSQPFHYANVFIPVGGEFVSRGIRYRCIVRPVVTAPRNACLGCAFSGGHCPPRLQCTKSERRDDCFVWFIRVEE